MTRRAPLAIHNRFLDLDEMRREASARAVKARGRARKAAFAKLDAIQAEIDAMHAQSHTWPECHAEISYGVPDASGKRFSHYMSKVDGVWVRHE